MLVACVIQALSSLICAFSVNYIMFIFSRFLVAFSVSGVFECGFVLGEFIRTQYSHHNTVLSLEHCTETFAEATQVYVQMV